MSGRLGLKIATLAINVGYRNPGAAIAGSVMGKESGVIAPFQILAIFPVDRRRLKFCANSFGPSFRCEVPVQTSLDNLISKLGFVRVATRMRNDRIPDRKRASVKTITKVKF